MMVDLRVGCWVAPTVVLMAGHSVCSMVGSRDDLMAVTMVAR